MPPESFLIFAATTALVVLSPGPAAITVASLSAGNGGRGAVLGIAGVASANVLYFVLSALGIASLMISSQTIFSAIKWIGVAYLVYIGVSAIIGRGGGIWIKAAKRQPALLLYSKGFVVEFANPKALLFFAAILPQFLDHSQPILGPLLTMGAVTLMLDVVIYSGYAILGHALVHGGLKDWVIRIINKMAGGALLIAGVKMATITT